MQINNVIEFGKEPMDWKQALEQMEEDAQRMREGSNAVE